MTLFCKERQAAARIAQQCNPVFMPCWNDDLGGGVNVNRFFRLEFMD